MTLTIIEQYAFGGNRAHFVAAFEFDGECITVRLTSAEKKCNSAETILRFPSARMLNEWTDTSEGTQWPLDIIGFDCDPQSQRWKFVLTCDTKEWIWDPVGPPSRSRPLDNW